MFVLVCLEGSARSADDCHLSTLANCETAKFKRLLGRRGGILMYFDVFCSKVISPDIWRLDHQFTGLGCLAEVVLDFFESVDVDPSEAQYLLEVHC